jgi:cobaltochelatase CobN
MHLLATDAATLDEIETAVDLGQTPADVVVLSFSDSDLSALAAAWTNEAHALPSLRLASLKRLRHPLSVDLYVDQVVAQSRLVIVRSLGGLDYWRYGFERVADACLKNGVPLVALPGDDRADAGFRFIDRAAEARRVRPLSRAGGAENLATRCACRQSAGTRRASLRRAHRRPCAARRWRRSSTRTMRPSAIARVALVVFYRASLLAADTAPIAAHDAGAGAEARAVRARRHQPQDKDAARSVSAALAPTP